MEGTYKWVDGFNDLDGVIEFKINVHSSKTKEGLTVTKKAFLILINTTSELICHKTKKIRLSKIIDIFK